MHDVLRARLIRKIESLPEAQVYQVLDYIEFLESKYADVGEETSGLQKMAEGIEDSLRKRRLSPSNLREAFQLIAAADRALSGVAQAGRQLFDDLTTTEDGLPADEEKPVVSSGEEGNAEEEKTVDEGSSGE